MPRRRRSESEAESPEPPAQRRRTQHAASDDDDGEDESGANITDMSKKLVRLAFSYEYQRRTIRRADISEKVLGSSNSRKFKEVWNQAQGSLRDVFGVELVELPVKEKVTLQQRRDAQKKGNTNTNTATTSGWILQSILPDKYKRPDILSPPSASTPAEESIYVAIYTMLISLIGLSGGSLPDAKMERYISKLGMADVSPLGEKTEFLFKRLQKDGYIVRSKESTGTGEDDVQWLVGPRGKVEVGEKGVRGLTKAVWGDLAEEDDEEMDRKIQRSLGVGERMAAAARRDADGDTAGKERRKPGRRKRQSREDADEVVDEGIEMEDGDDE